MEQSHRDAFERVEQLTADDYNEALEALWPRMTAAQRTMLLGHASAPHQTLSMADIAAHGGYDSYATANVQYGKLGRMFASHFGIHDLFQQIQMLAVDGGQAEDGQFLWTLRPQVCAALQARRLVDLNRLSSYGQGLNDWTSSEDMAAILKLTSDPSMKGVPETMRKSLVKARIGQGDYRRRMLGLWEGACAVTGCTIEQVLIASHAKSWALSTNEERLDEFNGLLLSASIDRLFDAGLIAFEDDGSLLLSEELSGEELATLGISRGSRLRMVHERHKSYLRAHRQLHGFSSGQ